jgi:subtilisin family serine protease
MRKINFTTKAITAILPLMFPFLALVAQTPERGDWYNLDYEKDKVRGISSDKAHEKILTDKKGKKVVVAVIDSGTQTDHEDLENMLWTNSNEISGTAKDDDKNGYIDDIHGWNFLGNAKGENIAEDNLESTRLYVHLKPRFEGVSEENIRKKDKENYQIWLQVKKEVEENREQAEAAYGGMQFQINMVNTSLDALALILEGQPINKETVEGISEIDASLVMGKRILNSLIEEGLSFESIDEIKEMMSDQMQQGFKYFNTRLNYHYNTDFDPRSLVGDDYSNSYEKDYGNNDYEGPDAAHGTHVAGIIAAERGNQLGIEGICSTCEIMTIRAVPDGDERDKDVANSIIYAVDNGAKVINMSFGKGYSWDKKAVDKAVLYAMKKDVLLVHAAGNSGQDNDNTPNFPNARIQKSSRGLLGKIFGGDKTADNWLEVGASTYHDNEKLVASFSNYGKNSIDVFAPGFQINSTIPGNGYAKFSGTSMASPVVAGIAGVIRSYYPNFSAKEVRDIIMDSAIRVEGEINKPGSSGDKVTLSDISKTGAIANLYTALQLAEKRSK